MQKVSIFTYHGKVQSIYWWNANMSAFRKGAKDESQCEEELFSHESAGIMHLVVGELLKDGRFRHNVALN